MFLVPISFLERNLESSKPISTDRSYLEQNWEQTNSYQKTIEISNYPSNQIIISSMVELMSDSYPHIMTFIDHDGTNSSASKKISNFLNSHFKDFFPNSLQNSIPMISVIGGDILHKIKSPNVFKNELIVVDRKVKFHRNFINLNKIRPILM
jgi:hypothetical protein